MVAWCRGSLLRFIVHILCSRLSNRGRGNRLLLFFGSFGQLAVCSQRIVFGHALAFSFFAVRFFGLASDGVGSMSIRNSRGAPRTISALTSCCSVTKARIRLSFASLLTSRGLPLDSSYSTSRASAVKGCCVPPAAFQRKSI